MDIGGTNLTNNDETGGAHYPVNEVNECGLGLGNVVTVVAINSLTGIVEIGILLTLALLQLAHYLSIRTTLLQAPVDQLKRVPLDGKIWPEAVFRPQRSARWQCGVDTDAVEINVFRILDEIAGKPGVGQVGVAFLVCRWVRRVVDHTTDVRKTAVITGVVEPQLGPQVGQIPTQRGTELILVPGLAVAQARRHESLFQCLGIRHLARQ